MKAKTKLTKLWSILLALVMVVGMMPTVAMAAGAATETADFSADPTTALALLNAAKTDGAADSEWNNTTKTLTLNGVNFETGTDTAVRLPDGSTIVLNGDNTITGGSSVTAASYGIYADGALTIQGTGTLNVTAGDAVSRSCGIYTASNTDKALTISSGTVIATSGDVSNGPSLGIYTLGYFTISGTADVTGNGGTAAGDVSFGINAEKQVNISGGTVTAIGGAGLSSEGIYSGNGDIMFSGGTVTAIGGAVSAWSVGIYANTYSANLQISGTAEVTAIGGSAGDKSYGIYSRNTTISGGTVIVKANTRVMDKAPRELPAAYQWRISNSGDYSEFPGSAYTWDAAHTYLEIKKPGYTITFDANGGGGTMTAQTGVLGEYTLPANGFTAPEGKQFKCWSVDGAEKVVGDKITVAADTTVKAVWENTPVTTYTVSFDANGGTGTMTDVTGVLGDYTLPANGFTAPNGKQFKCWSVNGTEKAVGDKITVAADTTVKAVWENIPVTTYTVSFDANGGTGTMADVTGIWGDYTLPANGFTAPNGKQFKGWSVNGTKKAVGDKITVTADTTVKAVWENIPAAPAKYDILDGANSSRTQNSGEILSIRGSGEFSKFVGVKVDGTLVDAKNYTVKEGSTIVTLKADYLNTLAAGRHTLEIVWTDGSASTAFTVNAKTGVDNNTQSPQTGDNNSIALWIALLFVSVTGALGTAVFGKKKKNQAE